MRASWICSFAKHHLMHLDFAIALNLVSSQVRTTKSTDLKLAHFPTLSPLPVAALPSMSLIPSAPFADSHRFFLFQVNAVDADRIRENPCHLFLNIAGMAHE